MTVAGKCGKKNKTKIEWWAKCENIEKEDEERLEF